MVIWIIYYNDEAGTPKVYRRQAEATWIQVTHFAMDLAGKHSWSGITKIELLKTPVLNKEAA